MVWPEELVEALLSNAWELTSQAMATQVRVVFSRLSGVAGDNVMRRKAEVGLRNLVVWLDEHLPEVQERLSQRDYSVLEIGLFCLGRHLEFRETLSLDGYPHLSNFCSEFESRHPAARATAYRYD